MRSRVFLETSVISYLTAGPRRDVLHASHRQLTREWWSRRDRFDLYVSRAVILEISRGNPQAAAQRLAAVEGIQVLAVTEQASELAGRFLQRILPAKAAVDALHIAVAVVHGMDYLLTWNCTHIANAAIRARIESACRAEGLQPPVICTPEELTEE